LKDIAKYQGIKTFKSETTIVEDAISVEAPLRISINGEPFTVTMRTPGNDENLATGLLYSEDIIKDFENVTFNWKTSPSMDEVNVIVEQDHLRKGFMNARNFLSVSSCGVCGKTELPEINGSLTSKVDVSLSEIENGYETMRLQQVNFNKTGGCHAAGVLNYQHQLISVREDIGRHNAVDKAIGDLIQSSQLKNAKVLLVSGRISYEIIIKTFRAKIPILAAVSSPSSLAIDYAKELGITLYAFCRLGKMTKYA
jgi:FdhD protein